MRKLKFKTMRSYFLALFVVAAAAGGLLVASTVMSASSPTLISFHAVSSDTLKARGTIISVPVDTSATTENSAAIVPSVAAQATAEIAASKAFDGAAVREAYFAHCVSLDVNQDCWAVSLDPSTFETMLPGPLTVAPSTSTDQKLTYLVALIDPGTGRVLTALWGGP